jgi:hypothetical protein
MGSYARPRPIRRIPHQVGSDGIQADIYSANDIAAGLGAALERPMRAEAVPHDQWETLFGSQGMKHPTPRIRMIDGFNEGWIDFESGEANSRKERPWSQFCVRSSVEFEQLIYLDRWSTFHAFSITYLDRQRC